jgi:predicted MFS family arabinose efflux permease
MRAGAKWGAIVGVGIWLYIVNYTSQAFGFYTGSPFLMLLVCGGGGLLAGLCLGWLANKWPGNGPE